MASQRQPSRPPKGVCRPVIGSFVTVVMIVMIPIFPFNLMEDLKKFRHLVVIFIFIFIFLFRPQVLARLLILTRAEV